MLPDREVRWPDVGHGGGGARTLDVIADAIRVGASGLADLHAVARRGSRVGFVQLDEEWSGTAATAATVSGIGEMSATAHMFLCCVMGTACAQLKARTLTCSQKIKYMKNEILSRIKSNIKKKYTIS